MARAAIRAPNPMAEGFDASGGATLARAAAGEAASRAGGPVLLVRERCPPWIGRHATAWSRVFRTQRAGNSRDARHLESSAGARTVPSQPRREFRAAAIGWSDIIAIGRDFPAGCGKRRRSE